MIISKNLVYFSNFDSMVDNAILINLPTDNLNTKEDYENLFKSIDSENLISLSSNYDYNSFKFVKLIPYTKTSNEDGSYNIKIDDRENILQATSEFYIIDINKHDIFMSDSLIDIVKVKRTSSGYFNLKIDGDYNISLNDTPDNIILFYNV